MRHFYNSSSDKEALAERSKEEFNRQVKQFNQVQKQYYTDSLPNLCRTQQDLYKNLVACWKVSLREYVKFVKKDNDIEHQTNTTLQRDVDQIDRSQDSDLIFNVIKRPSMLPVDIAGMEDTPANMTQKSIKHQNAQIVNKVASVSLGKEVSTVRSV